MQPASLHHIAGSVLMKLSVYMCAFFRWVEQMTSCTPPPPPTSPTPTSAVSEPLGLRHLINVVLFFKIQHCLYNPTLHANIPELCGRMHYAVTACVVCVFGHAFLLHDIFLSVKSESEMSCSTLIATYSWTIFKTCWEIRIIFLNWNTKMKQKCVVNSAQERGLLQKSKLI